MKKLSIIIPYLILDEQIFELAKENIRTIKKYTDVPYEIVAVDNASPKHKDWIYDTAEKLIINKENRGNPGGWNDGVGIATGDYYCFMDDDVKVEKNWIKPLLELLDNPEIGVAFPMSKNKEDDDYFERLAGFCWIIRKDTWQKVGEFDEIFNPGNFEDTDWYMRAKSKGYQLKCSKESRVTHYSRATTVKIKGIDDLYAKNEEIYFKRWGYFPLLD